MTEKELMLTSILGCRRTDLYAEDIYLTPAQDIKLRQMQERRKSGEPLQYILGECDFMGINLKVDSRVLIPRPETEILVETVIERLKRKVTKPRRRNYVGDPDYDPKNRIRRGKASCEHFRILELGTGSGNIAVSLAKYIYFCSIVSVDISYPAIELAYENARKNAVEHKINFVNCDMIELLKAEASAHFLFDVIVSNPPYIESAKIGLLPTDVKREPQVALNGGFDGLEYYRVIIAEGAKHIKDGGLLVVEVGDGQREALERLFHQSRAFNSVQFIEDYTKTDRIALAQKGARQEVRYTSNLASLMKI